MTAAGWLVGQLPERVREDQRAALVRTLGAATDLVIEVHTGPAAILIRDGDRALLKFSART